MARIPEAELERIKRETPLVDLVKARGIELKKHGKDLAGLCRAEGKVTEASGKTSLPGGTGSGGTGSR